LPDVVVLAAELAHEGDALRRLMEELRTPVIVLGDESGPRPIAEAKARGAVDHLPRLGLALETLHRAIGYAVEHRRTVDRLRHDALTGLPNRTLFLDRRTWSPRRARRRDGQGRCAVLFLRALPRPQPVQGHQRLPRPPGGRRPLRVVAQRLPTAVRTGDTVARLSGDEFTVLRLEVTEVAVGLVLATLDDPARWGSCARSRAPPAASAWRWPPRA
jgi:PleD family two-component response regulator